MSPRVNEVGVLLVNLGTPDAPEPAAVRRYLREFLSDPRVIDVAAPLRWLLLELVILPRRPATSAAAYAKVWTAKGSPLLVHGLDLAAALGQRLGAGYRVALGMRYGRPSIRSAVEGLLADGVDRLVVLPLYPHETSSSVGSSVEELFRIVGGRWSVPSACIVPPFHGDEGFRAALVDVARPVLADFRPDHALLSFHGLPERHVRKSDARDAGCLASAACCDAMTWSNATCYRAQCHDTARELARRLGLADSSWSIGFQSRLGRTPWIRPWTDVRVRELAASGVRRLAVLCPGFVADCLETIEEIGIRARDDFRAHGGGELLLVPSLNSHPRWVDAVASLVRRHAVL